MPYLSDAPGWLNTTAVYVGLFALSILAANLLYAPIVGIKAYKRWRARKAWNSQIRDIVEEAPFDERAMLANLVTTGRKAFAAKMDDRRFVPLLAKGIIRRVDGQHSVLGWPHIVQDDVWTYLCANKNRFVFEKAGEVPDPLYWHNNQWN